jgi:glycosyltransferase involved in cell wall biosynthesis
MAASGRACAGPVAMFLPSLDGGGAERIMLNLAAGFVARGYFVDLVLASAVGEYRDSVPCGVRLVDLRASKPLTAVPALARYLRAERPMAMLATIINANLAALWALRLSGVATRCVVREASTLSVDLAEASALNRLLLPRLVARSFRRAEAIVAPSRGVADDFVRVTGLPRESIQVIYNPVVSDALRARARQPTSHHWLQGDDVPVIVGMGRLTRAKNFATLIRAFARLRRTMPARLVLLGEGEDRGDLEALCRSLGVAGDVDLPGFVANPYAVLSRARLFVLSSRWEGLPGALIEALACGTKVVSTDCPSGPREILDDGRYGQLVPVGDTRAMANAMRAALDGSFVAANPGAWIDRFDAEANTGRYLNLLVGRDREPEARC